LLEDSFELAHVARPWVVLKTGNRLGRDPVERQPPAPIDLPPEVLDQERNVFASIAKRRHLSTPRRSRRRRSSRKAPCWTAASRFRCVAEMSRTSTRVVSVDPSGLTSPCWRKRSSMLLRLHGQRADLVEE
jgi:hypothetical protein